MSPEDAEKLNLSRDNCANVYINVRCAGFLEEAISSGCEYYDVHPAYLVDSVSLYFPRLLEFDIEVNPSLQLTTYGVLIINN